MLQKMVVVIRQDLQDQILSRRPKRKRLPDLTTGTSSVIYGIRAPRMASNGDVGELEPRNGDYSVRLLAPFENVDSMDTSSEDTEDAASESCPENVDRAVHGHLSFEGHTTATHTRSGEYDDDEDDRDGGVLLFKGRRVFPS
jgi:hypothetical protein